MSEIRCTCSQRGLDGGPDEDCPRHGRPETVIEVLEKQLAAARAEAQQLRERATEIAEQYVRVAAENARLRSELEAMQAQHAQAVAALEALAKVQYDGTVEGLREQMRTEDWGDVLAIEETKAAYELTLALLRGTEADK